MPSQTTSLDYLCVSFVSVKHAHLPLISCYERYLVCLNINKKNPNVCKASRITLSTLGKTSADGILKYISYFTKKTGFDISCKLSSLKAICMKCKIRFSGGKEKKSYNLSSAELAQRVVKFKPLYCFYCFRGVSIFCA